MRKITSIALLQLRLLLKAKGFLMVMFVLPLAFIAVMSASSGGGQVAKPIPLAVVDADGTFAAGRLVEALGADKSLAVLLTAAGSVDSLLADHAAAAALVIPSGFERSLAAGTTPAFQLISTPGSQQPALRLAVGRAADAVTTIYSIALATGGGQGGVGAVYEDVAASRKSIVVAPASAAGFGQAAPDLAERALGLTVMFVVMAVLMLGGTLLDERQAGTWDRMLSSTASWPLVLAGMFANLAIAGLAQFAVLATVTHLLFKVNWGAPLPLTALATATALCAAGLAAFIASLSRTPDQQRLTAMMVAIVTSMFGGAYWSLDLVSPTMRTLGHVAPQAWILDGLRALALHNGGWADVGTPITVLMAVALVSAIAGTLRFGRDRARARRQTEQTAAPVAL